MSGHSKWSTIKRQKESKDAKKGQVFTKLAKAIIIAVKAGGGIGDPEKNFKLRLAIDKAKALNMPKENILRAIQKGEGEKDGANWSEVTYEGYGPESIAVIIEVATDNKNRTTSEIKNIFDRVGGTLASPGAVAFQFKKTGLLTIEKDDNPSEQILKLMDLEVEDIQEASDVIEIYTKPEQTREMRNKTEALGFKVLTEELIMKPLVEIKIVESTKTDKIFRFMETLEEHDDVQKVFSNFDIAEEILN